VVRALTFPVIGYILGMVLLLTVGPFGGGPVWLFAFPIIVAILLGLRFALISLALNVGTIIIIGILLQIGHIDWDYSTINPIEKWVVIGLNFMLLNSITTISIALISEGIQDLLMRQKSMLASLEKSEEKYRILVENANDSIFVAQDGTIKFLNQKTEELTGYLAAELIKKPFVDFIHPDDKQIVVEKYKRRIDGEKLASTYSFKIIQKSGFERTVHINTVLIQWENKPATLNFLRDITQQIKIENQLQQAQKMESVGRLAGGVAHDYNNALTTIMGYTELAMMDADPKGPLNADLNEVLKAGKRAKDITRQLLAFARKQTITPVVLMLNDSIESMIKMLRRLIGEDIDFVWLPGKGLGNVKMDPSQIDQIIANLCVNARDAIDGVGKTTVETNTVVFDAAYCADHAGFMPGEFVLLAVSDNGCGMDKEILDNIFEPFFTTKTVGKGTGLGLPTVYGIVKQNNGFINVYSEPGKGTSVKIYLPRHEGKAVEVQKGNTEKIPKGNGETILVVEDDPSILKLAKEILEGLNYTVLIADTPKGSMKLAKEHSDKIHLLITDVIMPIMNGRELSEQLQSLSPDLKCIFMSGYTANAIAHHGVLDEGVYFVQKPFSKNDLATIVRKVLNENE
jgi:two-component system, cell cycle sensor histidine kinase and response regulator CckA